MPRRAPLTHTNFSLLCVCAVGGCLVPALTPLPPLIMLAVSSLPAESLLFLFFSLRLILRTFQWPNPFCCIRSTTNLFIISFLSHTQDFFFFFLSLWIYLWLAETSQQPISQTTWLKVTPHCNHGIFSNWFVCEKRATSTSSGPLEVYLCFSSK